MTPSARVAALSFAVGAAWAPLIPSGAFAPRWWALAVGLPLAMPPAAAWPSVDRAAGICLIAFACFATAATVGLPARVWALDAGLAAMLGAVFIAHARLDDPAPSIDALGWGVAASSPIAVLQFFGAIEGPPSGFFLNSEVLAEVSAVLLVWALIRRDVALSLFLFAPVAVCGSRVAAASVAAGLLFAWRPERRWLKIAAAAGVVAAGLTSTLAFGLPKAHSAMDRVLLWTTAAYSFVPGGRGVGWWGNAHPGPMEEFAHSDVLQAFVEVGAGAAFLVAAIVVLAAKEGRHAHERGAFAAAALQTAVSFPLHLPANGYAVAAVAGAMAGARVVHRRIEPARRDLGGRASGRLAADGLGLGGGSLGGREGIPVGPAAAAVGRIDSQGRFGGRR